MSHRGFLDPRGLEAMGCAESADFHDFHDKVTPLNNLSTYGKVARISINMPGDDGEDVRIRRIFDWV